MGGFSEAMGKFRTAWPKKGMTKEDRRLFEVVSAGLASTDLADFAALVALRTGAQWPLVGRLKVEKGGLRFDGARRGSCIEVGMRPLKSTDAATEPQHIHSSKQ